MRRQRHLLAVYRATHDKLGGIGAHRGVPWTIQEIVETWGGDPRTIRLQVVDVENGEATVMHDVTYDARIAAAGSTEAIADEVRRAARLDDLNDSTVHSVLYSDTCTDWRACPHRKKGAR